MGKLVVTVVHPTERVDNTPLQPGDILRWETYARAVGATNWTLAGTNFGTAQTEREVNNVPLGGDWEVRVVWYDQHEQSAQFVVQTDVPEPIPAAPKPGTATVVFVP